MKSPGALRVLTLSPIGLAWLDHTTRGRVLHVFDQVCNLVNSRGEVLSLVTPRVGPGPFNLVVGYPKPNARVNGFFPDWVDPTSSVWVKRRNLHLGAGVLRTDLATLWDPVPLWGEAHRHQDFLFTQIMPLKRLLLDRAPADSLAFLFAEGEQQAGSQGLPMLVPQFISKQREALHRAVHRLGASILSDDRLEIRRASCELAGSGGGLTPAGDDYLVGVMYALWALHPADRAHALAREISRSAIHRTTTLSAAWLDAASRGEADIRWHALLSALGSEDTRAVMSGASRLVATGHTSGADALTGFLTTLMGHSI